MTTLDWETHFRDTGCKYSPTCQTCPLPKCKYDMNDSERARLKHLARRAKLVQTYQRIKDTSPGPVNGEIAALAAAEAGVTVRTIYRALEAARDTA